MNKLELIQKLRKQTFAGMSDCKKALEATNYDLAAACDFLRQKGLIQKSKKIDFDAAAGRVDVFVHQSRAVFFSLACQTDFVANTNHFQTTFTAIGQLIAQSDLTDAKLVPELKNTAGETIEQQINLLSSQTGEGVLIKEVIICPAQSNQFFGHYTHTNAKAAALLLFEGENSAPEIANELAMHTVAMKPHYATEADIAPAYFAAERANIREKMAKKLAQKPPELQERIVENKLKSQIKENTLVEQAFIQNEKQTINQILQSHNWTLQRMIWISFDN